MICRRADSCCMQVGIRNPEVIGKGSERNTAAFFLTVLFSTSALAVAGQFLPGDWVRSLAAPELLIGQRTQRITVSILVQGFFVPYLTGGISIAVLAIGSSAPGLLQFAIDRFSLIDPTYRERARGHEAAHLLTG